MSPDSGKTAEGGCRWALYGGAGFIGQHLALSVLNRMPQAQVYLLDLQPLSGIAWKTPLQEFLGSGRLHVHTCDVRDYSSIRRQLAEFDVIVNLAAIHREPGHRPQQYFDTNVAGAENVCRLAEEVGCGEIIFTSSISVYGLHDRRVDERTAVQPRTPYGQSKHQAENIHRDWAMRTGGRLFIVRPGVVFGKGENGNVTQLVREMMKRNRAIQIDPDRAKGGIYVSELVEVLHWLRVQPASNGIGEPVNAVSNENLTFNAYGRALGRLCELKRKPVTIPGALLEFSIRVLNPLAPLFPVNSRFHPQRLGKLVHANDIRPAVLTEMGYAFNWPLERALADWLAQGL